jgi:hypothetical protein
MKACGAMAGIMAAVCACIGMAYGAEAQDPKVLVEKAEKAKAAGDKLGALKAYTEAINAARSAGLPQESVAPAMVERDNIVVEFLSHMGEMSKKQAETVELLKGISTQMAKIAQVDKDVQERTKKNENKIKDIESILLDAVK